MSESRADPATVCPDPATPGAAPEDLERTLGHTFSERSLLLQALTHPSFVHEQTERHLGDNQRLEFLGDAVIQLVVSEALMATLPLDAEGKLTRQRSRIVRREGLQQAAEALGLGVHLRLGRGEEQSGGRGKPSVLADAFEALAGALFLDAGYAATAAVVRRLLDPLLVRAQRDRRAVDAKSRLQELTQGAYGCSPSYELQGTAGPDHAKRFTVAALLKGRVWGRGVGGSKKAAAQAAAAEVLARLEELQSDGAYPQLEPAPPDAGDG